MRVRAQLVVGGVLALGGITGLVLAVRHNPPQGRYSHGVQAENLWWLLPATIGVLWAQFLVVRYRRAVRRRLGQCLPVLLGAVGGIGLAFIGHSLIAGCGLLLGAGLLATELLVLGGVLGATSPG